jgi:hypothetical protein
MKKLLLSLKMLALAVVAGHAQTTILDFESPGTSTTFQYFGSSIDGSLNQVIANPNPSGINTSGTVGQFVKPAVAEVWAGAFSNPDPVVAVDLAANGKISVKVHMDHIGNLTLKLESSTNGGANWVATVANTKINEWEELLFDASLPSIEAPIQPAAGFIYTRVVLFFDFGTAGSGTDVVSYFDDIVTVPNVAVSTVLDFETPETGTTFQYFGSTLDGSLTETVVNPNPSGINESGNVLRFVKPAVAEVWAGAFSNPDPLTPVDLSSGGQVCVKVHMDHIGNLALKLEGSTSGQPNWITTVANTKVNEWEELCFDASIPSLEPPFASASGIYTRVVLFVDFGTAGNGADVISYLDDVVVKSSSAPAVRTVNFTVDMNSYSASFDTVYVSGSFNNWSGNANPLTDDNLDGIWEGSIAVANGLYEYKITLDNWDVQEEFEGFEECTRRDPSGQFVNRFLAVSSDVDVPRFCFNSCYACGEEVKVTFRLGMNGITPSQDGVWLAGGGNFDVPGGKYKMNDDDANGIWEIVVPRRRLFSSYYAFANGACPDYSCKENLAGQPCGNPAQFDDRFLPAVANDTVVATCFGACFTNAECISSVQNLQKDVTLFQMTGNPGATTLLFSDYSSGNRNIALSNSLGQTIGEWQVNGFSEQFILPLEQIEAGIYFVTVRAGERFLTRKLVR